MSLLAIQSDWMLLAGIALLTGVFVRLNVRRRRSAAKLLQRRFVTDPLERIPRPKQKWEGVQHDAAALVNRESVELHETAREIMGQLASKIAVFERLVSQSSSQIKRMESLLDELHAVEGQPREGSGGLRVS
ncbi:MAG: hypothetical protein KF688_17085 [Pirellulales bacterium]|nr:hypothetical protein [Pirellulales bacterium]